MNKDETDLINEIYYNFLEDQKKENRELQNNLNRIREIEIYLKSITENSDLSVFSPRSAESIYADKIKDVKKEKSFLEETNKDHYHKLNELNIQIEKLKQIINKKDNKDIVEKDLDSHSFETQMQLEVLNVQEKERQRIARELHDTPVQDLTHLVHMIELSSMFIDQDPIRAKLELENCIKILKSTINEMREIIFNLRPMSFDDLGFKQCIEDFISECKLQYNYCDIEYDICELKNEKWKNEDKQKINLYLLTIYRVIQEPIVNALKHSDADKIILNISTENDLCQINISDNGKGFSLKNMMEKKDKHFGLSILEERINLLHGKFEINTDSGKGTEIKIEFPLI